MPRSLGLRQLSHSKGWLGFFLGLCVPHVARKLYNPAMYSQQLLSYFQDERNVGEVARPDLLAQVENPVCGDVLRLTAKVEDRRMTEVRFKVKGCVPAMACSAALCELLTGCSLEQAARLTRQQLIDRVGGLPPASDHASYLATDALALLLRNLRS